MGKYHRGIYRGALSAGEEQVYLTDAAWGQSSRHDFQEDFCEARRPLQTLTERLW